MMKSQLMLVVAILLLPVITWAADNYDVDVADVDNHGWVFRNLLAYQAEKQRSSAARSRLSKA